jgi:hypothetical protein
LRSLAESGAVATRLTVLQHITMASHADGVGVGISTHNSANTTFVLNGKYDISAFRNKGSNK